MDLKSRLKTGPAVSEFVDEYEDQPSEVLRQRRNVKPLLSEMKKESIKAVRQFTKRICLNTMCQQREG